MTIAVSQEGKIENKEELETHHDIYFKDASTIPADLEKESVQLVVTSPPYWSIKDYGNKKQLGFLVSWVFQDFEKRYFLR